MKRQGIHAFLPLNGVDSNHGRLAGELDCRNNCIELVAIEIVLELLPRLPFLYEHEGLAFIEVRVETGIQATRRHSRWPKHRAKSPEQLCSRLIGGNDLHRENDQGSILSAGPCEVTDKSQASLRNNCANTG